MSSKQECSFGVKLSDSCHLLDYTRSKGLKPVKILKPQDIELLSWRVPGSVFESNLSICLHHEQKFLIRYSLLQKKCFDPFQKHKGVVKSALRNIPLEMPQAFKKLQIDVVQGQTLCAKYRVHFFLNRRSK